MKYILFGAGRLGQWTAARLLDRNMEVVGFSDNNSDKGGSLCLGLPVYRPAALKELSASHEIIITVYTNGSVVKQLRSLGVPFKTFAQFAREHADILLPYGAIPLPIPHPIEDCSVSWAKCRGIWADDKSVIEFDSQIKWRQTLDPDILPDQNDTSEMYFPKDLFKLSSDEVFIDCGAFDGDTVNAFLRLTKYKKIIALEPDPVNREAFSSRHPGLENVSLLPFAVSDKKETVTFDCGAGVLSAIGVGNGRAECDTLDNLLADEVPTFIKMDIEGAEAKALLGAANIIDKHQPILAICLYHKPNDLWEIPLLVHKLNPRYKFYLRRYSSECWEQVLYAIPESRVSL